MSLPTHRIEIHKHYQTEEWVNTYYVNQASMAAAEAAGIALASFERALHLDYITFDYVRVSTTIIGDRTFDHIPLNNQGQLASSGLTMLPLYVTTRLDLRTNDSDPARKYYRGMLTVNQVQTDLTIVNAWVTARQSEIDAHAGRPSLQGVVTPKGNIVQNQLVADVLQERQLHRRRRPVVTP